MENIFDDTFEMHVGDAAQMKLLSLRSTFNNYYINNKQYYAELMTKCRERASLMEFDYTLNTKEKNKFNKDIEKLLYSCGFITKYINDDIVISWM